jgi:hypothetical protein
MFIAVKLIIYILAAHFFYTHGFDPTKKLMDFLFLMSCMLLMDVISYFSAKFAIEKENLDDRKK